METLAGLTKSKSLSYHRVAPGILYSESSQYGSRKDFVLFLRLRTQQQREVGDWIWPAGLPSTGRLGELRRCSTMNRAANGGRPGGK